MAETYGTAGTTNPPKKPSGEALGIIPNPTPRYYKKTKRYRKDALDLDSIIAFLNHLYDSDDMPTELMGVRSRLRDAFPGLNITKTLIRAAYAKAGWDINELSAITKKQKREAKELDQSTS